MFLNDYRVMSPFLSLSSVINSKVFNFETRFLFYGVVFKKGIRFNG